MDSQEWKKQAGKWLVGVEQSRTGPGHSMLWKIIRLIIMNNIILLNIINMINAIHLTNDMSLINNLKLIHRTVDSLSLYIV